MSIYLVLGLWGINLSGICGPIWLWFVILIGTSVAFARNYCSSCQIFQGWILRFTWRNISKTYYFYFYGAGGFDIFFGESNTIELYQKTCNRLSSTSFQGWQNKNDAHFLVMWPLDQAFLSLNYVSCIMWWGSDYGFGVLMVTCWFRYWSVVPSFQ